MSCHAPLTVDGAMVRRPTDEELDTLLGDPSFLQMSAMLSDVRAYADEIVASFAAAEYSPDAMADIIASQVARTLVALRHNTTPACEMHNAFDDVNWDRAQLAMVIEAPADDHIGLVHVQVFGDVDVATIDNILAMLADQLPRYITGDGQ